MSERRFHRLKCWPEYFRAVKRGDKTCEVRRADRDFRVGDCLLLLEFDPKKDERTGDHCVVRIRHVLQAHEPPRGLCEGFVVLSIEHDIDAELAITRGHESIFGKYQEVNP